MAIHVLDQNTINKIAAGEVVERPSSVVKELVENAIDAHASAITIEIKDGGISFIRITDNGCGIEKNEIPKAFLRHATSKIKSAEDLLNVSSLGFRGEALSSIAAVSQVELITKTEDELSGYRYVCEGGVEKTLEEVGAPSGTTFIVRNLFYNTPARRKFLKSAITEAGYISSLVEHLSLSHPDISFRFINNNQNRLHTSGNMNLKDIIYNVYGRDIVHNLIEIKGQTQDIEISGYIAKPVVSRGNRGYESYYINGRYIKSNIITKAIEEAYKGYIMPHNYPFTVIHFKINPSIIDVNVHPTKMELRFSKNDFVQQFVLNTIKEGLLGKELIPEVSVDSVTYNRELAKEKIVNDNNNNNLDDSLSDNINQKIPYYSNNEEKLKNSSFKKETRLPEPFELNVSQRMIKEDTKSYNHVNKIETKQMSLFEDSLLDDNEQNKYRIIGQLFKTYWLIEYEERFYMMDQHAAHEKILYEDMMNKLKTSKIDSQLIMPPVILSLNMMEKEIFIKYSDVFKRLGYEYEEFGGNEFKITAMPATLPKLDTKQLLIDIIDTLVDENEGRSIELISEKIASMSCKAAVKGNSLISEREAKELMYKLMKAENPYNCPHGRPTLIMMTKYEIEKKFKRII